MLFESVIVADSLPINAYPVSLLGAFGSGKLKKNKKGSVILLSLTHCQFKPRILVKVHEIFLTDEEL